ncbi:MAG: hypothetical protein OXJ53_15420 [Gammaproteobacteria bacterium]|nr:hypothetical protein [Gammaproteobacteria bacterium]
MPEANLRRILENPTLHPNALTEEERHAGRIKWHGHADLPNSSQILCISAFGTLRYFEVRNEVIDRFVESVLPAYQSEPQVPKWDIFLEHERPELLNEMGSGRATSIDALLVSSKAVIAVEAKFAVDAEKGFGTCSTFHSSSRGCAGFYGPGSDLKTKSDAWCRLEAWDGRRSPRTYWALGRSYFRPETFRMQDESGTCPFRDNNYQLMRNFLFAASYAHRRKIPLYGVITIAPPATSSDLADQVDAFQSRVLQPQFADLIQHTTYGKYLNALRSFGDPSCAELAEFLDTRIDKVING